MCVLPEVENGSFLAHLQIRNIHIPKLDGVDWLEFISHISGFLQEVLCHFISGSKHELCSLILQFLLAVKFGSILPKKQGPEVVMESGSHISYTKPLKRKLK